MSGGVPKGEEGGREQGKVGGNGRLSSLEAGGMAAEGGQRGARSVRSRRARSEGSPVPSRPVPGAGSPAHPGAPRPAPPALRPGPAASRRSAARAALPPPAPALLRPRRLLPAAAARRRQLRPGAARGLARAASAGRLWAGRASAAARGALPVLQPSPG